MSNNNQNIYKKIGKRKKITQVLHIWQLTQLIEGPRWSRSSRTIFGHLAIVDLLCVATTPYISLDKENTGPPNNNKHSLDTLWSGDRHNITGSALNYRPPHIVCLSSVDYASSWD